MTFPASQDALLTMVEHEPADPYGRDLDELAKRRTFKIASTALTAAGPPDQPRDDHGRWMSGGGKSDARDTRATHYGLTYAPGNDKIPEVLQARKFDGWDTLPSQTIDISNGNLNATEEFLSARPINEVLNGEPIRQGYDPRVVILTDGRRFIVDGHHRVAMHLALGDTTMSAKVLDLSKVASNEFAGYRDDEARDDQGRWATGGGSVKRWLHTNRDLSVPDGGFTVAAKDLKPVTTGYAVAIEGTDRLLLAADAFDDHDEPSAALVRTLSDRVGAARATTPLAGTTTAVGGWHNPDDAKLEINVTVVFPADRRDDALAFARANDQIAILHLDTFDFIPTGGTGGERAVSPPDVRLHP